MSAQFPTYIKSFKRNNNNTYERYYLGAYPEGIEMASSFDLEEEFKIGGNKQVFISDVWPSSSSSTVQQEPFEITEVYYDNTENHNITHTIKISISSATTNFLVDNNSNVIYTATELQNKGITVDASSIAGFEFDGGHNIEMILYKGEALPANIMHTKNIYIRMMEDEGVQLIKEVIL